MAENIPLRIAADLRRDIRSGKLAVREQVPSTADLAVRYSVSRQTAQQALNVLRREGIVETRGAKGTYVAVRPPRRRLPLHRFARARATGQRTLVDVTWNVHFAGRAVPPPEIAAALDLPVGTEAVRRTHTAHDEATGEPVEWGGQWFPAELVDGSDVEHLRGPIEGGMFALVERLSGRRYTRATDRYTVGFPTPEEAAALRIRPDTPVLRVTTVHTDADELALEISHATYPGHGVVVELRYRIDEAEMPEDASDV
jgi:DNA-binding GntR family transcriptional regulator